MNYNNKRSINETYSKIKREIAEKIKPKCCYICKKNIDEPCNSHTIPRFVLKSISKDGYFSVPQINIDVQSGLNIFKRIPLTNAFTFKLICSNCDNTLFKKIEMPEVILDNQWTLDKINLLALKSSFGELYDKLISMEDSNISPKHLPSFITNPIDFYEYDIKQLKTNINSLLDSKLRINMSIAFEYILDYETKFATICQIIPVYNEQNTIINRTFFEFRIIKDINNPNNVKIENYSEIKHIIDRNFGHLYIAVLPNKSKTKIIVFYPKKFSNFNFIKDEFSRKKTLSEKLKKLSDLLVIYTKHIYYNSQEISDLYTKYQFLQTYTPNTSSYLHEYEYALDIIKDFNLFNL